MTQDPGNPAGALGRIEVVPDVLLTIAQHTTLQVEGVAQLAEIPPAELRRLRRRPRLDGIVLDTSEGQIVFDLYVVIAPGVNIMETSRAIQQAIIEAIDNMVGTPVGAVHVHVEDVAYQPASRRGNA